jgi:hypothetical protein
VPELKLRTIKQEASMRGFCLSTLAASAVAAAAVLAGPAVPSASAAEPVRIAVFEFELSDVSGGSGIITQDAADTDYLRKATEEARRLLAASGRYSIVDTSGTGEVPRGGLQSCSGCEAAMAGKLGADQSMAGVVTRITRLEYTVQIVIRNANTGALVSNHFTDARMGANYAWTRGVKRLMETHILAARDADARRQDAK